MNRSLSIFLDLLRFAAAFMVFAGHFTQPHFSYGWTDRTPWAVSAVSVFFVLSGFVISHVTASRETTPLDYTAARIARLYSVLVPAAVLCLFIQLVGTKFDSGYIATWINPSILPLQVHNTALRIAIFNVATLTFLNSIHGQYFDIPLDNPVWSLGFEAPYYALFGIVIFTRGVKRYLLIAFVFAIVGYGILSVLPVWLLGVALHRLTLRIKLSQAGASALIVSAIVAAALMLAGYHSYLNWVFRFHGEFFLHLVHSRGRAASAPIFYFWGIITSLAILAAFAADQPLRRILIPLEKPIRWFAGHTFSLYLFHFPLLILVNVTTHYNHRSYSQQAAVFASVLILCMILSKFSEEKKHRWRQSVHRVLSRVFTLT